ncbi:alpha-N-arabinofuranosidase [Nocardioides sp. S-58]|uniref:non-reducing end alpha-L-arabinofuranosidase n=1 Tax=Nocardioides renjunii TaxID=3095075 RepID=A0ABU5K9R2_9ACTN|nr:alpha-N-arabinofuranosidase [Nocardioides sp. S-58]MDZ5661709.1 alpha-N-arabinofuranosidase [Nocardioides sp. S-58]
MSSGQARLVVDLEHPGVPVDRRLFGAFVEHVGRAIHTGVHEPGHPSADARGFRTDVVELVRELGVSAVRYPGGNFVSGYRWEDGVGPRESRPTRLDLAWHSTETNEVGLHEFAEWLEEVGSDLVLALNLGTRGTLEALDLLEYANVARGTTRTDERARNGRPHPFGVRTWCLGNEMDGPWQLGHRSADDYGKLAAQTARAMRLLDPDLELVLCGSSSRDMPTFGEWERTVLTHAYDEVDLISCHAYYEERDGDLASFLASAVDMDAFIDSVVATIDHVRAVRGSEHRVDISFDEWNVWYLSRFQAEERITSLDHWPRAPRLLEDVYTVADAVVVGSLLISLLRHADRVRSASLAQLVNAIAPVMTEPGGPAWRQTTFFPFALTSRHARGSSLPVRIECDEQETARHGVVPLVDAAATRDEDGTVSLFVVNRSQSGPVELDVVVPGGRAFARGDARTLHDDDHHAVNTLADPTRVGVRDNSTLRVDGDAITLTLPPVSWSVVVLEPGPA